MTPKNVLVGLVGATLMFVGLAVAQKDGIQKHPDPAVLATENVKELLLLMDTDKNGKITKQEWMKFMAAEFDRLNTDKAGELDQRKLMQSRVSIEHVRSTDLGK
jgi:hypothetical protein